MSELKFINSIGAYSGSDSPTPIWKKVGTALSGRFNAETALKEGNIDFDVALRNCYYHSIHNSNVNSISTDINIIPNLKAIVRTDTDKMFTTVSNRYHIYQNRDIFKWFDSFVTEGNAIYETAGALNDGAVVFISAILPNDIILPNDDLYKKYLLFVTSHDGSTPITILFTPTRVLCANTLKYALRNGTNRFVIKHTKNANTRLVDAAKTLGVIREHSVQLELALKQMIKYRYSDAMVERYIECVFLTKEQIEIFHKTNSIEEAKISQTIIDDMASIYAYYHEGIGQNTENTKGTLFGAYNAVTGYYQNVKSYKDDDLRFRNLLLSGVNLDIENNAFKTAYSMIS